MNKKRKALLKCAAVILLLCTLVLIALGSIVIYAHGNIDFEVDEALFRAVKTDNVTRFFYDGSGYFGKRLDLYEPIEFATVTGSSDRREWCSINEICDYVKNGFIAVEDRDFYKHCGVNVRRTLGAAVNYFLHFTSGFGASTLTQQVVKNISGDSERTAKRKINEIIRACHIEKRHSKEEIFEVYLNVVPLGERCIGIGTAAETYFGKKAVDLTLGESATLVGITNAPSRYNPYKNMDACLQKRDKVLYSMLECGFISDEEYVCAKNENITLRERQDVSARSDSWFVETVCDELSKDIALKYNCSKDTARAILTMGGLSVYTTVDYEAQLLLEEYFENTDNFPYAINDGLELAMTVCDPKSADLRAIVGGVGEKRGNRLLNYATLPRTPGSALKPIALYAPLIDSKEITWATVFDDVPVSFSENSDGSFTEYPRNSPAVYNGLTTVADALRYSKNTVAVRLYNILGAERIYKNLHDVYGIDSIVKKSTLKDGRVLTDLAPSPLALGQLTNGIELRTLTEAYTPFSSGGIKYKGRSYVAAFSSDGSVTLEKAMEGTRVFGEDCAKVMTAMLCDVVNSGTASSIRLKESVDVAGKTGTSGADRDRLFVGYTPYFCAGIWCGYKNSDKSVGCSAHLKVWDDVMVRLHSLRATGENVIGFSTDGLEYLPFCKDSGHRFSSECIRDARGERMEFGYFIRGTYPREHCKRHVLCRYDTVSEGVVCDGECPIEFIKIVALLDIQDRKFPKQITVKDAEYVFRELREGIKIGDGYEIPYFYYMIPDGEYVGIGENKKQFNSACFIHRE